jgi:hypothetical protein
MLVLSKAEALAIGNSDRFWRVVAERAKEKVAGCAIFNHGMIKGQVFQAVGLVQITDKVLESKRRRCFVRQHQLQSQSVGFGSKSLICRHWCENIES